MNPGINLLLLTLLFHALVYIIRKEWTLRFETRKLNGPINSIGSSKHGALKYLRLWFRMGTYVSLIVGAPFTVFLFGRTIYATVVHQVTLAQPPPPYTPTTTTFHHAHSAPDDSPFPDAAEEIVQPPDDSSSDSSYHLAIHPILPGVNLPLSQLPYYLVAILISVAVHELGHALCSSTHKLPILSVGLSIFGPLIPAAHVELNSTQLRDTPLFKQLDILTAGVWSNISLALVTWFIVPYFIPLILFPTHVLQEGIAVTRVSVLSGVGGPGGVAVGDVIRGVDQCVIRDQEEWYNCLDSIWGGGAPGGYCVESVNGTFSFDDGDEDCCRGDDSRTHLCFIEVRKERHRREKRAPPGGYTAQDGEEPRPLLLNRTAVVSGGENHTHSSNSHCLPAQPIILSLSNQRCYGPNYECDMAPSTADDGDNQHEFHCLLPRLVQSKPFRIIQIHTASEKPPVLFIGTLPDLTDGLRTTDYVPRFTSNWLLTLPAKLETVLLLTAGLSAGLAVVNLLPIFGLDGYHIVEAVLRNRVVKNDEKISTIMKAVSWAAGAVAVGTVLCSVF